MRKSNNLEVISTKYILSQYQQAHYRDRLKPLLKNEGIISMCLEDRSLFIEYSEDILNITSIRELLLDINFPIKEVLIEFKNDVVYS